MEPDFLEAKAKDWIAAINENNLDALLALYESDLVHYSPRLHAENPETKGIVKGKEEMREWETRALKKSHGLKYELAGLTCAEGENWIVMEYRRTAKGQEPSTVVESFEFGETGLIESSCVYP